ncbi:MAG: protein jag [Oscillospiraceae bacterium]|nr:protein jag [Oscillospiraceae bacterium]
MRKWIEKTGRSQEDAINAALFELGLDRDDVSIEVLQRPKSGFLGFGSNPAKVRVSYEVEGEEETPVPMKREEVEQEAPAAAAQPQELQPDDEVIIAKEAPAATPAPADDAKAERIRQFLTGLMTQMEVDATPEISVSEEGGYKVVLQGQNLGAIIGRRGETLDAIQQLTNYTVNRSQSKRVRIHIDAEGYRAKREEALKRLAEKVAGKVVKYRKNVILESMNAYERHVIHSALQEYPDVTTYSTGTEPNRRTVVAYAPGEHR